MFKNALPFAVYLVFNGNCRQAFTYYQECFGGELTLQTMADTPHGRGMSKEMQHIIIYATLVNEYFKLVGTDLTDKGRIVSGNNVNILIECISIKERAKIITRLTGRSFCSINHSNPLINVIDQFRINWVLSISEI